MRAKHIYNKNAREKALLEEAYSQVNEGHAGPEVQVGSHVMWDRQRRFGIVDKVDDPENPTVAVVLDDDGAESIVDVKHLEEISGPIEDQEDDHDRHLEPSHGHGAAYVEDDPLEPSIDAEWSTVDALADILADLSDTWQEGKYSDADKESLKEYINEFIDEEIDDRKIDDGAPLPDHPAGNAWPHGGQPLSVRGQTVVPKLGRAAALRKEPGTDKDRLFYK